MSNIFYNVVSIIIGLILIPFGIITMIKQKKIAFSLLTIVDGILLIFFGVYGFFLAKEYGYITILSILAFVVIQIVAILTMYKNKS